MGIYFNIPAFQFINKHSGGRLTAVAGDDHTVNFKTIFAKVVNQAEYIHIVGDSKITTDFISFNVSGINTDNDLGFIF